MLRQMFRPVAMKMTDLTLFTTGLFVMILLFMATVWIGIGG